MRRLVSHSLFGGFLLLLALGIPLWALGQEADSTKREIDLEKKQRHLNYQQQFNRSMSGGKMSEMGTYNVPTETKYYKVPFKGQEYLDKAMEAYRKDVDDSFKDNWFWHFLEAVSPFINNKFEFGFYNTDVPFVDRDNPGFKSYHSNQKKQ